MKKINDQNNDGRQNAFMHKFMSASWICIWGAFVFEVVVICFVGGFAGLKSEIGELIVQLIGLIYWADRVRGLRSLFLYFWVDNDSPSWERYFFGFLALFFIIAGSIFIVLD